MKILTTVKKVVDVELNIHVEDNAIVEDGLQYVINAWDENAVEASVQLKESHGSHTTLVSVGQGDHSDMIRKCYAMGIDEGIHIEDPALEDADSVIYARVLQKVYEKGAYDLIITGKQAQDTDSGQTGIMLAQFLDLPCVSNVVDIEVIDDTHLKVSRLGDAGTEVISLELPALLTVSDSINEPRLPAMRGIMMAKKKKIRTMDLSGLGTTWEEVGGRARASEVIGLLTSKKRDAGQMFEGDVSTITAQVVSLLANEAKVF